MTANAFARRMASLERQVRSLATAPQLGHSTVDDGFLRFRDLEGNIGIRVGLQPDGSYTTIVVNAPTPLQPTDPLVVAGALAANVTWDGNLIGPDGTVDAELEQFATDRSCEIHAGATEGFIPDRSTLVGEIHNKAGGTAEVGLLGGQWWIRLMVRNEANEHGPPSVSVPVTIEPLVDGEQFDELRESLDNARDWIAESGATLDTLLAGPDVIPQSVVDRLFANVVRARKITTDMMHVGPGENLIVDPYLTDEDLTAYRLASSVGSWVEADVDGLPGMSGTGSTADLMWAFPTHEDPRFQWWPVTPGEVYRFRVKLARVGASSLNVAASVHYVTASEQAAPTQGVTLPQQPLQEDPQWHEWEWEAPDDAVGVLIALTFPTFIPATRSALVAAPHLVVSGASLIVDGTIQGRHVEAESVAAEVGEFLEINANQIKTGVLEAVVTISGRFQTATSGTRAVMDPAGFAHYDSTGKIDLSMTGDGIELVGTVISGSSTNGIYIAPDGSRLGNGIIEFRADSVPVSQRPSLSLTSGSESGSQTLRLIGPGHGTSSTHRGARVELGRRGGANPLTDLTLYSSYTTIEGSSLALYAQGDASTDESTELGGLIIQTMTMPSRPGPGIDIRSSSTRFRSTHPGGHEVEIVGPLSVSDTLDVGGNLSTAGITETGSLITLDKETIIPGGEMRIGMDDVAAAEENLRFGRRGLITSATNTDLRVRGRRRVYLDTHVGGTGNNWVSSSNFLQLGGPPEEYIRLSGLNAATSASAPTVYATTTGVLYRSTSLTSAKVAIAPVTDEQWRTVKDLEPVTFFDRVQSERLAQAYEGDFDIEEVDHLTPQVGFLAEQARDAGVVGIPTYGMDGELTGLAYERITAHHQMWHKEHDTRLDAIEQRLAALEG